MPDLEIMPLQSPDFYKKTKEQYTRAINVIVQKTGKKKTDLLYTKQIAQESMR
ncbi:hypothetical protein AB2H50_23505 (plasmid) [Escherichia coli]|uniref:hypothetical protein n=1 Tax=Escherichia coli TaxID=562 RepID=UPI0037C00402